MKVISPMKIRHFLHYREMVGMALEPTGLVTGLSHVPKTKTLKMNYRLLTGRLTVTKKILVGLVSVKMIRVPWTSQIVIPVQV